MKYLVKMTPLEPYSFGTDQSFKFEGVKNLGKDTYYVRSKEIPEQTTVLGMLRYLILQNEGLLKTDFLYTAEEKVSMSRAIGPDSFSFAKTEPQDFGMLQNISPVFLVDRENHNYVKNPFHNKSKETGYAPMEMEAEMIPTSSGVIHLLKKKEFDAKKGYAGGYYCLYDGTIVHDLFHSMMLTGNCKNSRNNSQEDGFFKREVISLKEGYSFAVYAEAERLPERAIAYMGQKKSAFLVTAQQVEDVDLMVQIQKAFSGGKGTWMYAASDLVVSCTPTYDSFCIVEQKRLQNLETVYEEKNHTKRLKKSNKQYNLICAGSVFYDHFPLELSQKNYQKIGYNYIVQIGGLQE